MGHAGAIIGGADDTAAAKMKIMKECGIFVVESPAEIGETMVKALSKNKTSWKAGFKFMLIFSKLQLRSWL
jgi:succinyl-CoA synthetase alpha subunit